MWHSILADPLIRCRKCRKKMHRRPQAVLVSWGGLPPHLEATRGRVVREILDPRKIGERREDYERNLQIVRNKAKGESK